MTPRQADIAWASLMIATGAVVLTVGAWWFRDGRYLETAMSLVTLGFIAGSVIEALIPE